MAFSSSPVLRSSPQFSAVSGEDETIDAGELGFQNDCAQVRAGNNPALRKRRGRGELENMQKPRVLRVFETNPPYLSAPSLKGGGAERRGVGGDARPEKARSGEDGRVSLANRGLVIHVPVRTVNELNATRWHWRKRSATREAVKEAVTYALLGVAPKLARLGRPSAERPWSVLLVRLGPHEMDDDGVVSALKSVRDAFAKFIAVDDKHRRIVRYAYDQERSREFGVRIEVALRGEAK